MAEDHAKRTDSSAVIDTLVASHRAFLAFVERRVHDQALAEEIVQDALVKMPKPSWLLSVGFLGSLMLAGCSTSGRIAFRPTDASFRPSPRASDPEVFVRRNEVPRVALRSVGIIEVTGPDAISKAAAKGRELGCWALVEHSVFDAMQSESQIHGERERASSAETSSLLAHGGVTTTRSTPARRAHSTQFDCVMQAEKANEPPATPMVM